MSELPVFPVYDRFGEPLLRTLGSFWYHYFGERDRLETLYQASGHLQGQAYLDYLTAVATVSRFDVPVFKSEDWYLLVLKQSDRSQVQNLYGQTGLAYGGSARYGDAQTAEYLFALPDSEFFGQLTDIPYAIYNRVVYPSKTWTRGLDFEIDHANQRVRFREDPFQSEYVAKREIYDAAGAVTDTEVGLWVYRGQFDLDLIYRHWAFAVTEQLASSQGYKDFMNALWDGYSLGANAAAFSGAISAMLGVPVVLEAAETVIDIVAEVDRQLVITDKHVYSFQLTANVTAAIGDALVAGDQMVDVLQIIDLSSSDHDAAYGDIPALSFGGGFLSGGYFSELSFKNAEVAVEYLGIDTDNKAVVTFELGGFPGDVEAFFLQAQELGKRTGYKTLAELLDTRENPVGQPLPEFLPATINPLEFVLEQIMKNNLILLKVRATAIDPDAPGLSMFRYLRNIVPAHTTYLVFVEIGASTDTMDLAQAGSESEAGVADSISSFYGIPVDAEEVVPTADALPGAPSYEDIVVRVYPVSEECK